MLARKALCVGLVLTASGLMASPDSAQTLTIPLESGDPVSGMGSVQSIKHVFVNDSGTWFATVVTDSTDLARNEALLRNGAVVLREGDPVSSPPGATINLIGPHAWTDEGRMALAFDRLLPTGMSESCLVWETGIVSQEGGIIDGPGVAMDSRWKAWTAVKVNSSRTILVAGGIDSPTVAGSNENFAARLQVGAAGELLSTEVLARKAGTHPAITGVISSVGRGVHQIALNERGDIMLTARGLSADSGAILINGVAIAREGESSPVQGRVYSYLANSLDLNDFGEWAFIGAVRGDGYVNPHVTVFVKNGELFAQEGDVLPSLGSPLFDQTPWTAQGTWGPIYLTNSDDLFWVAQTDSSDAFMRNHDVLVREGNALDGRIVSDILALDGKSHASDDGRYWVGTVQLDGGDWALIHADLGLIVPVTGCLGNRGSLRLGSGLSLAGHQIELLLDDAQAVGALPILTLSLAPAIGRPSCGIATPLGEILISPAAVIGSVPGPVWNGSPSSIVLSVPDNLALVGLTYYAQGLFWDAAGRLPGENVRLTNGIRGEIGAP